MLLRYCPSDVDIVAVSLLPFIPHALNLPYFSIDNARVIYTKKSKFVKNEHARYTLVMKRR